VGKLLTVVTVAVLTAVLGVATLAAALGSPGPTSATGGSTATPGPGAAGTAPALPAGWAGMEQAAAATCPGLSWSVLAAIGTVESDSGRSTAPGVASGANPAGAEGPMQFEPATFATPTGLRRAVLDYDHSAVYADTVLSLSLAFADDPTVDATVVAAVAFAAGALGTPYRWGGNGPGGFDCSGLTRAAYAAAGTTLPRVAQDQFDRGPAVPGGSGLLPGDLIFFGSGPTGVDHVGLYVGAGLMIDAPHTGAVVRVEPADWSGLVGATRPG